jgi:hypothetical protein
MDATNEHRDDLVLRTVAQAIDDNTNALEGKRDLVTLAMMLIVISFAVVGIAQLLPSFRAHSAGCPDSGSIIGSMAVKSSHKMYPDPGSDGDTAPAAVGQAHPERLQATQDVLPSGMPLIPRGFAQRLAALAVTGKATRPRSPRT